MEMLHHHEIATFAYFYGRFLNAVPGYLPEAESFLRFAVINGNVEAMKYLGICLYKKGEFSDAGIWLGTFLHQKGPEKETLHYLSYIEVYLAEHAESPSNFLEKAIIHAEEAVRLDDKDGFSWYILGGARCFSFFLLGEWDLNTLQLSLFSYEKAYADVAKRFLYPHITYEMAMVCTFLEEYEAALRWYSFCGLTTPVATRDMQRIIRLLDRLNQLLQVDYNITVEQLLENDEEIDDPSFMNVRPPYEEVNNNELVEGYNKDTAIVGRVLHSVTNETGYPLYYVMCDSKAERFILTVHGIHEDAIHEGNLLILKEPYCKIVNFEWNGKAYRFRSVRLNLLGQVLVNGAEPSNEFKFSRSIRQRE